MDGKFTTHSFLKAKRNREKITMLTAYDYSMARIVDESGVDAILVGDSLGMVMQGYESALEVTMEDMVYHCRCVSRGAKHALLVGDLPFLSYHISTEEAVRNAGRLIQEGKMNAVKLEGGRLMADTVRAIVRAQIPVMGHIGLTPQSVNVFGGFKVQGKQEEQARALIEDALALEEAGVFAIVLEAVPEELARLITDKLKIPTIGIGAGRYCDGQVLVIHDMLGMFSDFTPKFVKQYAQLNHSIKDAVGGYIREVKALQFPEKQHTFCIDDAVLERLYGAGKAVNQ
jgi:3-methyl-2-oxobutanoate hydroxymethyltransferase